MMSKFLLLILGCCLWQTVNSYDWQRYVGYELIQTIPETVNQLEYLQDISEIDFWEEPTRLRKPVSMLVHPDDVSIVQDDLDGMQLSHRVMEKDITREMEVEWERLSGRDVMAAFNYSDFNDFNTTIAELDNLAATCLPGYTCTVTTLGYTYEGRPMNVMKISKDGATGRRAVWIDSQIHALEWLSSATTMNIFKKMMSEWDTDPDAGFLLNWDWYFLPIVNPDGYHRTWVDDRLWRKNMSPNNNSNCTGTDLNRNYDFNWGEPGASAEPCAFTYHGSSAASEYETQAVQDQVSSVADTIDALLTFHTYGNYLLAPLGNCTLPPEWQDISRVANATCAAIMATFDTVWECGNSCELLYRTSGATPDWAYGQGIPYSWTLELRGDGLVAPPTDIPLSYAEVWNGLNTMLREIIQGRN